MLVRDATLEDIEEMMSIRNSVRENALVNTVIARDDYVKAMTQEGRAWVCEVEGTVVGFSCGRPDPGDIWALFVRESFEGRGIGNRLMDAVEAWMFEQGLDEIWLRTSPNTRADRLYRHRGWNCLGLQSSGELEFRLAAPDSAR